MALLAQALGLSAQEAAALEAAVPRRRGPADPRPPALAAERRSPCSPGGPSPPEADSPPLVGRAARTGPAGAPPGRRGAAGAAAGRRAGHRQVAPAAGGGAAGQRARLAGAGRAAASAAAARSPTPRCWSALQRCICSGRAPPRQRPTCRAVPGWCACCPNWRRARSSRCPPGRCRPSRSGG